METRKILCVIVTALCFLAVNGWATVPNYINYQGMLTDDTGNPITGTRQMDFAIYPDSTIAIPMWTETHGSVDVIDGLFRVKLGSLLPLSSTLFNGSELWLGITVSPDIVELSPRQALASVPYGYRSETDGDWSISGNNMYSAVSGNVGIGLSSPSAKLELRGAIKNSTVGDTTTIIFSRTAETGIPTGDGFRMKFNNNYYGANCDALVLEKVDGQSANPDGGIVFTNTGNDGVEESALTIRGNGDVGIGIDSPDYKLHVEGQSISGVSCSASGDYSTVSGGLNNTADGYRATICGGVDNVASGSTSAVGGGYSNNSTGGYSVIGGGISHTASGYSATIAGGAENTAAQSYSTVGGGIVNYAGGSRSTVSGGSNGTASGDYATVSGGFHNKARGYCSVVSGGGGSESYDSCSAVGDYSTISGGSKNLASGQSSCIGGGENNVASGNASIVSGGLSNTASGINSVIAGGYAHTASATNSTVSGGRINNATNDYATVGGGYTNQAIGENSTVSGGALGVAGGESATVCGGCFNRARGDYSVVSGGGGFYMYDSCSAVGNYSTISGGSKNYAPGHSSCIGGGYQHVASGQNSTIGGGHTNTASGTWSTVGGGGENSATGSNSTVAGGYNNSAGDGAAVGGGDSNEASSNMSTIAGGNGNTAGGQYSTIGGGWNNTAIGSRSTVSGGENNTTSGYHAAVGGGYSNSASGHYATVAGGLNNTAEGQFSFAAGRRARANHDGAFVWADNHDIDFASSSEDQFLIRASGGVGIGTNAPSAMLHVVNSTGYAGRFDGGLYVPGPIVVDNKVQAEDSDGLYFASDEGTIRMHVNNNGNIGIHTTSAAYPLDVSGTIRCSSVIETSDDRLKTNVQTLDNALEKVERLRGVSFQWNAEGESVGATAGEKQIGVLASEVEQVFPELVSSPEDGYKSVDYTKLTAVLIEAVKEQQEMIEELRAEVEELKGR
jgi:hypothetical protein